MKNFKNFLPQVFERCLAIMAFYFPFIEVSAYFGDERLKRLALFRLGATVSARNVQLQMTIVLQWRWPRKRLELLKSKSLRLAT